MPAYMNKKYIYKIKYTNLNCIVIKFIGLWLFSLYNILKITLILYES